MLKIDKLRVSDDCVVVEPFDNFRVNDIVPANTIEKTRLVNLWIKGKVRNLDAKKYTKQELEQYGFSKLKDIGAEYGVTDRSKAKLITEILEVQ